MNIILIGKTNLTLSIIKHIIKKKTFNINAVITKKKSVLKMMKLIS